MMRIAVTGSMGQVATSLLERAGRDFEIVLLGRRVFLLEDRAAVLNGLKSAKPDVVINAAAYTLVDEAETEESLAVAINGEGAGNVADAAARIGAPLIQLSTDHVFDGALDRPWREDDPAVPANAYGRSKLAGERAVADACDNSAIVRTAWLFSPHGENFVRSMLALAGTRDEVSVVADQRGNPTSALDLAGALLAMAVRLREDASPRLRGVFHVTNAGEATWADVAEAVFSEAAARGRSLTRVRRIATADYFTPAPRPANARLDTSKVRRVYGLVLPDWRTSLAACCGRLMA